jgi:SAM-dependent methyltransferase
MTVATEPALDLSRRVEPDELPELMDEPASYEDLRACLIDLAQCNTLTLAARPTLDFLDRLIARQPARGATDPLRIVDVGSGGGDMLRRVERWATHRGVAVELTGIDLNPFAARAAREFTASDSRIRWMTGDAFSFDGPVDVILSALFTHHLSTPQLIGYLQWAEARARRGWFINDLCREATPLQLFPLLAHTLRWHRFVQHDGPISFRRSFREDDWQRLTAAAGIPAGAARTQRWTPGRLCVERMR